MTSGDPNIILRGKKTEVLSKVPIKIYRMFLLRLSNPVGFLVRGGGSICPPYGEVGSDRHWGAGYAMAPLLSGDCAPLRDGAPYDIVRTIFLRVVTPLLLSCFSSLGLSLYTVDFRYPHKK